MTSSLHSKYTRCELHKCERCSGLCVDPPLCMACQHMEQLNAELARMQRVAMRKYVYGILISTFLTYASIHLILEWIRLGLHGMHGIR